MVWDRRSGLGVEFFDAVDATLDRIVRLPAAGARVPNVSLDLLLRRAPIRRFPYHVIDLETNATIRVIAVAHDRRRPGYWNSRL